MTTLDLRPEWLEIVQRLLAQHVPHAEVWAYGSRVTGTAHDGSDLDLIVRNPQALDRPSHLGDLRQALGESDLPILVEVLDWAQIPETFRLEIGSKDIFLVQCSKTGKHR